MTPILPWIAHLYTATGAVIALLATAVTFAHNFRAAFLYLVAATIVDATDGVLARAGAGLTMLYEAQARDDLARGDLVSVLEEFSSPFPGYYLYYPQRRHTSPALRALIDYLLQLRQAR